MSGPTKSMVKNLYYSRVKDIHHGNSVDKSLGYSKDPESTTG